MHRFKRFGRWLLIGLLLIGFVYWLDSAIYGLPSRLPGEAYPPRFTLSKETTYFTGPVDKNGYIDYAKALNETLAAGIEPEQNVIVALLPAIGPKPYGKTLPPEFFTWLGAPAPAQGDRVVTSFEAFVEADPKLDPSRRKQLTEFDIFETRKRPWKAQDQPEISAWLKANEKALSCAMAASYKKQFFFPLVASEEGPAITGSVDRALAEPIQVIRDLGIALIGRAQLKMGEGRYDDARMDLLCVHRLARMVAKGPLRTDFLLGRALEQFAFEADGVLLAEADFPRKTLEAWGGELDGLPDKTALAVSMNLAERCSHLEEAMLMNQIGPAEYYHRRLSRDDPDVKKIYKISNIQLDYNLVLESINRKIDNVIDCLGERDFPEINRRLKEARENTKNAIDINKGNYIYDIFSLNSYKQSSLPEKHAENILLLILGMTRRLAIADAKVHETEDLFHLALALEMHRKDRGAYPAKLANLIPAFLPKIPGDRFSRGELTYGKSTNGYLLYSVGANGKDEEGRGPLDEPSGDDLRVMMPKPKLDSKP